MRRVWKGLVLFVSLASCVSAPARRPSRRTGRPRLDGRVVYPTRLADPALVAYWQSASAQSEDAPPELGGADLDAAMASLRPWIERRERGLRALAEAERALLPRGGADALFATVVYAFVADELGRVTATRPLPAAVPPTPAAAWLWRQVAIGSAIDAATFAVQRWRRCVALAGEVPEVGAAWAATCAERASAADRFVAEATRRSPDEARVPVECGDVVDPPAPDPEATPPDEAAPREVAVVYAAGEAFDEGDRERILDAVAQRLARDGAAVIPAAEVRAARALQATRRWRPDGPVCGQAPPLPALLAARHRNLVVAAVRTHCGHTSDEARPPRFYEACALVVQLRRAGTDDRGGLPANLGVELPLPRGPVERWVAAAAGLAPDARRHFHGMLVGGLNVGGRVLYFRAIAPVNQDPWLRTEATLSDIGEGLSPTLSRCVERGGGARGVGSYRLAWTISPTGEASEARAEPVTAPGDGSEARVAACLTAGLGAMRWPCPRDGRPVRAEARVCAGLR